MFSLTQAGNYAAFAGLLVIVLGRFGIVLSNEQAVFLIGAVVTVVGQIVSFYGRYRQGDLTLGGFRK